jgi:hemerythrin-like domain-containing protein
MFTNLGKPAVPADAVELLLECHHRIRSFLGLAGRLGEARSEGAEAVAEAAFRVHRYFTLALPLHARDEEESIAPRLGGREPALDAELAAVVREHREHERPLAVLVEACARLARDPGRHRELAAVVRRASGELRSHFDVHLAREEQVIFPAARRLLDAAADAAVVKEIRLRRVDVAPLAAEAPAGRRRADSPAGRE